ncbi:hypothetical protein EJ110_NYTH40057 [Nymphaea thermarum]|nr:hypothetical protein EJ110_NYTH40057 [Nymphaea thermarum]
MPTSGTLKTKCSNTWPRWGRRAQLVGEAYKTPILATGQGRHGLAGQRWSAWLVEVGQREATGKRHLLGPVDTYSMSLVGRSRQQSAAAAGWRSADADQEAAAASSPDFMVDQGEISHNTFIGNHDGDGASAPGCMATADVWLRQVVAMDDVHSNGMLWSEGVLLDGSWPWCQAAPSNCRPKDVSSNGSGSIGGSRQQSMQETEFFTEYGEASRYDIQEVIGKGSYGVVASAVDTHTGERVAIKKINDVFEHVSDATRILRYSGIWPRKLLLLCFTEIPI